MDFLNSLNDILWSYIVIAVLVGAALYFTIRSGGVQFRYFKDAIRIMGGRDRNDHVPEHLHDDPIGKDGRRIGSFQAFAVSLASRVGTGNLAGVASAIFVGGPGAVFWMWLMALLGGATAFVEATLAQLYKRKGKDSFYGGPAYYMESGLGRRWMGVIFSILMVCSFGLSNQTVQTVTMVDALNDSFGWSKMIVGIVIGVSLMAVVVGGVKRISMIVSLLVPFMAVGFIVLALTVVAMNITRVPDMFKLIFSSAFGLRQIGGGMIGAAILQGVKRGLFSNEAGEGSAPNAAAIAHTSHPVKQGLVQALGVFIDTIVICSCTAFIILLSGLWESGADGIVLTTRALEAHIGPVGRYFITAAILLFAFSTMIANHYYGENNIRYITSKKWPIWTYRAIALTAVIWASFMTLQQLWVLMDIFMGLLTLCNVIAIVELSGKAFALLKDYSAQKKAGEKDPIFSKSSLEDAHGVECW